MKSRCPNCQTIFRVTPEQLKARAGKVRCGQCQTVFNALDSLIEEKPAAPQPTLTIESAPVAVAKPVLPEATAFAAVPAFSEAANETLQEPSLNLAGPEAVDEEPADGFYISALAQDPPEALDFEPAPASVPSEPALLDIPSEPATSDADFGTVSEAASETITEVDESVPDRLSESAAQELGKATGLIMPRETNEIPGYSKWSEGVMAAPVSLPAEKPTRWPFILVALLLVLALVGQVIFYFRSEIATMMPSLRPMLVSASEALGSKLPLPRHVELISIEVSDLQNDPERGNLLVLNATLRNRAAYAQAYPSLELSLTDTQDAAVARRVFSPTEYLSPKTAADQPFPANSDLAVRVWIEARDIAAAGYRLYVFYP